MKLATVNERPEPTPEGRLITAALRALRPKLPVREAARRAGIGEARWRQITQGYQSVSGQYVPVRPPAETMARMAQVVGVTPQQLEEADRPDAAEELRNLPPEQGPEPPTVPPEVVELIDQRLAEINERTDARLVRITELLRRVLGDAKAEKLLETFDEPVTDEPNGDDRRHDAAG